MKGVQRIAYTAVKNATKSRKYPVSVPVDEEGSKETAVDWVTPWRNVHAALTSELEKENGR